MKLSAPFAASISKRPWSPLVASDHVTTRPSGSVATNLPTSVPLFSTMLKGPMPLLRLTTGRSLTSSMVMSNVAVFVAVYSSSAVTVTLYLSWSS